MQPSSSCFVTLSGILVLLRIHKQVLPASLLNQKILPTAGQPVHSQLVPQVTIVVYHINAIVVYHINAIIPTAVTTKEELCVLSIHLRQVERSRQLDKGEVVLEKKSRRKLQSHKCPISLFWFGLIFFFFLNRHPGSLYAQPYSQHVNVSHFSLGIPNRAGQEAKTRYLDYLIY